MSDGPHRGTHCLVNGCEQAAVFAVYASYPDVANPATHPMVHRYPMPMVTPCAEHLAGAMQADQLGAFATPMYVVQVLAS